MSRASENNLNKSLEDARKLHDILNNSKLYIVDSQKQFDTRTTTKDEGIKLPHPFVDGGGLVDPVTVSADVKAQLAFFRKLKFQYLEQKAKDQYIKIIVSDDAPSITAADNKEIQYANETKKRELKERKVKLAEVKDNIRALAPLVEQDYVKAKALSDESVDLAQKILDARLKLNRLRQAYPQPRLTIPVALAKLDTQVEEMQQLQDKLQSLEEQIDGVKEKVKVGAREVERLRVERAEVDKLVKQSRSEIEDGRVLELCDWYSTSLRLHKSLYSLKTYISPSENELHLSYAIASTTGRASHNISVTLLFLPNTRQLADARIAGLPSNSDMSDVIGARIQSNDVPGLVAAVLARARAEVG
ncbi:hypothetical protein BDY19DRAFT_955811 [Irpex rosettiformis]|uniref:Uncharacterized protein n=1 Tax=Irpex rosettiformis TaxID=378272 RepID=A0ACB8TZR8_9APHY|nr:hypothetical protein BDY19DRAFT_955811 [Irpex rosettiformis]